MHDASPPQLVAWPAHLKPSHLNHAGFSLVEISLAIGIIAFAFVGLIGLLPVGLTTFRDAIDTGNEARIIQSTSSKLIATEYDTVKKKLGFDKDGDISYYDEEGLLVDTENKQVPSRKNDRLYESKLFIEDLPEVEVVKALGNSVNAIIVFANMASSADKEFKSVDSLEKLRAYLKKNAGKTGLKVRPVLISKMDGQPPK